MIVVSNESDLELLKSFIDNFECFADWVVPEPHQSTVDVLLMPAARMPVFPPEARETVAAWLLWMTAFNKSDQTYVFAHANKHDAHQHHAMVLQMLDRLPGIARPGITRLNRSTIDFDNGGSLRFAVVSPHAFRGYALCGVAMMDLDPESPRYREAFQCLAPCLFSGCGKTKFISVCEDKEK